MGESWTRDQRNQITPKYDSGLPSQSKTIRSRSESTESMIRPLTTLIDVIITEHSMNFSFCGSTTEEFFFHSAKKKCVLFYHTQIAAAVGNNVSLTLGGLISLDW